MLTRPYLVLCVAMAMATMGIGMATPILPVYAKELGASGAAVGLTFSSFALTQVIISPFSGRMADQYGRKPFLIFGLVTYVIAALGWWFTSDVTSAILLRAFSGVGSALIFSLASAYIGDIAPEGQEGRFMGVFGVATFAGMGLGPLVVRGHPRPDRHRHGVPLDGVAVRCVLGCRLAAASEAGAEGRWR